MGRRFNLGDKTGVVQPYLESKGLFPPVGQKTKQDGSRWTAWDTAMLCIGQGEIMVTPLQMALVTAAIANGGKVLRPRLVMQLEEQGSAGAEEQERGERAVPARARELVHPLARAGVRHLIVILEVREEARPWGRALVWSMRTRRRVQCAVWLSATP